MAKEQILLHACCATCAGYVLEKLMPEYNPIIYYFNPNIYPPEEYYLRRDELSAMPLKRKLNSLRKLIILILGYILLKGWNMNRKKAVAVNNAFIIAYNKLPLLLKRKALDILQLLLLLVRIRTARQFLISVTKLPSKMV